MNVDHVGCRGKIYNVLFKYYEEYENLRQYYEKFRIFGKIIKYRNSNRYYLILLI